MDFVVPRPPQSFSVGVGRTPLSELIIKQGGLLEGIWLKTEFAIVFGGSVAVTCEGKS